ncbi:PilN domain-containing protein [Candidatus Uhrbacteria bacterium]|nr:PilN domain-containing protein [Candidatus Uhrbacteria bacterium]
MLRITLNLLPPQKKEALRQGFVLAYAQTMVLLFGLVVVLIATALIPVRLMLKSDFDELSKQNAPETDEFAISMAEIRDINSFLRRVDGLQTAFVPWASVLKGITESAPAGIQLENIRVAGANLVVISGTAGTRDALLAFEAELSKSPFLSKIESPLSNILQRQNFKFEIQAIAELAGGGSQPAADSEKK